MNAPAGQLNIAFESHQGVLRKLRAGDFCVLIDYQVPVVSDDEEVFKLALAPGLALARYTGADARVAGLSISTVSARPAEVEQLLEPLCRNGDDVAVCLSGCNADDAGLRGTLAAVHSHGIGTVIATTGFAGPEQYAAPAAAHTFIDSCDLIRLVRNEYPEMCVGAYVNPFKYNVSDVYLQYFKMIRKLNTGADFIVAEAGWDMKKYQELQWYLRSRNMNEPIIAKLMFVQRHQIAGILDHRCGGVVMSREMAALLERESNINERQATAAQVRRIAMSAAGCRLFGYSGIQIGGIDDPQLARILVDNVEEAFEEFTDFRRWLTAWNDFHDRVEMAPMRQGHYAFKHLMDKDYPDYVSDQSLHAAGPLPQPTRSERLKFQLARALRLESRQGVPFDMARQVLCGHHSGRDWRLDKTFYVCAAACPKGLESGPCGGTRPDGTCEFGHQPCIFHRILALANWRNELESLEAADEH